MGQVDDIRNALSGMVVDVFADTASIEYRNLTSNANANPRTYSAWTPLVGARTIESGETQVQDPDSGLWFRERAAQLRIPLQLGVVLSVRSQVRTAGVTIWSVREALPGAAGSVAPYNLVFREPMLQDPRKGGV